MKHTILIVGDSLGANGLMIEYIKRIYLDYFCELGETSFSPKSNPNLPFLVEKLAKESEILTIFASQDSFSLIGKILTTLSEDVLVVENETLTPAKAKHSDKNSYLIELNTHQINVLHVKEGKRLPPLLSKVADMSLETFHLIGLDSETCEILLEPLMQTFEVNITTSSYVQGWLKVQAKSNKYGNVGHFIKSVHELFRGKMFIAKDPIEHIIERLEKNQKTISMAESCTGGLISAYLTSKSGASNILGGGLTTYSNEIKSSWLGVDEEILKTYGAVSEETLRGMLEGCLKASNAHISMATSGVAGPSGGTASKPVGTVFVGVANKEGNFLVERLLLEGDRNYIQTQSAYYAFKLLFELEKDLFF